MCDHHQLSFLLLHQGSNCVHTRADDGGSLGGCVGLSLRTLLSTGTQALLLVNLALRPVLVEETEQLGSCNTRENLTL